MTDAVPITSLTVGTSKATDEYVAVDVTDTTQSANGTTKQYQFAGDVNYIFERLGVNTLSAANVATTAALTANYNNGALGVGATLTNSGVQAVLSIDGVTMVAGYRVVVKDQAAPAQNGVYTVTNIGSASTNWVLTRATDFDVSAEILDQTAILVLSGSTNADIMYSCSVTEPVVVGTDAINFIEFEVTSGALTTPVSLANGGTNKALVAADGGIVYSDANSFEILAPVAAANRPLVSGLSTAPSWATYQIPAAVPTVGKILISDGTNIVGSVPTYPSASGSAGQIIRSNGTNNLYSTSTFADTYAASNLLYSNGANTVQGLATAASGVLVTDVAGVPSISTVLPALTTSDPVVAQGLATKKYVDDTASGRIYKDPCNAATTGALTATYDNGTSGVGATLTNAGAMAAFATDGYSASLNDRILVKDQAGGEAPWNGIYVVTTVGSGAANWVLTRATDMDEPDDFLYGTTFIISGTTNAGRTYTETATIVTVGTTNVAFTQTGDATGVTSVTFTGDGTVLSSTPSSAVTTSGTLTASLNTQTANIVFAGPTSGGAANPTFRTLVAADMPSGVPTAAASQAEQEAGSSTTVYTTPGRQQYHPSASKSWVYATNGGSPTIAASYNVGSLSDNATGTTTVNFTTNFSGSSYCGVYTLNDGAGAGGWTYFTLNVSNSASRLFTYNPAVALADIGFCAAFFGDQ